MEKLKIKRKNYFYIETILFFFQANIVFFFNIIQILKNKSINKKNIFIISLYMGILGFLISPLGDLYRHTTKYYSLKELSLREFLKFLTTEIDYGLNIILYIFSKLKISIQCFQFLVIFFCYYSSFYILNENQKKGKNILYFFILFFSIDFFSIGVGLRSGLAAHIYILGLFLYYKYKKVKAFICFMIALLIHYYIIPLVIIVFLSKYLKNKFCKVIFILSLIFIFKGEDIIKIIFKYLYITDNLAVKIDAYIYGYWAKDFLNDFSWKYKVSLILKNLLYYPILGLILLNIKSIKNKKVIFLLIAFTNLFYNFWDIFGRYSYICRILGIYILANEKIKNRYLVERLFLILSFFIFITNLYSSKINILNNYQFKILYKPIIFILKDEYYNEKWLEENTLPNGYIKEKRRKVL